MPQTIFVIGIILLLMFIIFYSKQRKINKVLGYLNSLLANDRNPDLFLTEIDDYIAKQKRALYKTVLIILKSKGLIWKGLWEECLENLDTVKPNDIFNDFNRIMFHYNTVFSLFNLGRSEDALSYIAEHETSIRSCLSKNVPFIVNPAKKIFALRSFYTGDYIAAEEAFNELDTLVRDDFSKAVNAYYLGLIAEKNGDKETAELRFKTAVDLGESTYLPAMVGKAREV